MSDGTHKEGTGLDLDAPVNAPTLVRPAAASQQGAAEQELHDGSAPTLVRSHAAVPPAEPQDEPGQSVRVPLTEGAPLALNPGRPLAGRYTVLERLGQGGMGVVLSAYDARLDRRVALKLLRSQGGSSHGSDGEGRLVREAQAMARLNHPHVVHVYDAGTLEGGSLFIAMEYVEGQTLRSWRQQPRSWREVLEAYLAAGRGLAAAHTAGLVHRDFKPDNVLVGRDGQVRVTDFGLARAERAPESAHAMGQVPLSLTPGTWSTPLTLEGTLMGTPGYMAPELLMGHPADVRSDVFAFCVSLYEALYGHLPFEGREPGALIRSTLEGRVSSVPAQSEVPRWVARTVLQGLQADPQKRPASMAELLAALEADPEVRRRAMLRLAAAAGVVLVLGALAVEGWRRSRGPSCAEVAQDRLSGVWDEALQARVRDALLGTRLPYAEETLARTSAVLEGYTRRWAKLKAEVCEASQGPSGPRQGLVVLQESCLERRRSQVRALTELLSRGPDRELLDKAVQVVQGLPPLEYCTDAKALTAAVPPPEEPDVRARVETLQEQVDRLGALLDAGKYKEGLALGEELLREVAAVGYAPLQAHVFHLVGRIQEGTGDYRGAEERVRQAITLAAQGKDVVLMAQAWSSLASLVGLRQARHQEAVAMLAMVSSVVELADDNLNRIHFLQTQGLVLAEMGKHEEASERYERALALLEKTLGLEHLRGAPLLNSLGMALRAMGRYEEAKAALERAVALMEKVLGPKHPHVPLTLGNLGNVLSALGRHEEAREQYERALALVEQALGPEHPMTGSMLNNLGAVLWNLGKFEEARARYERALAVQQKTLGPEHPFVLSLLNNVGATLESMGKYQEARAQHERVLALREKTLGPEHPDVAASLDNLGSVLTHLGRYPEAQARLERSLALREKAQGAEHPDVADSLGRMGYLLMEQGRYAAARQRYERALAVSEKVLGPRHSQVADLLDNLGKVLTRMGSYAEARRRYERALALRGEALGLKHSSLAGTLLGWGKLLQAQGQLSESAALLERALVLAADSTRAEVQFALARVLWETGQDRSRALVLATQARAYWQRLGHTSQSAEVSTWLADHGG